MFDSITSKIDLISRLIEGNRLYGDTIKTVIDLMQKIQQAETRSQQVKLGLRVLKELATITETQADDHIVRAIDAALSEEMIGVILRLVGPFLGDASAQSAEDLMEDQVTAQAFGLSPVMLFQLAMMVAKLIKAVRK